MMLLLQPQGHRQRRSRRGERMDAATFRVRFGNHDLVPGRELIVRHAAVQGQLLEGRGRGGARVGGATFQALVQDGWLLRRPHVHAVQAVRDRIDKLRLAFSRWRAMAVGRKGAVWPPLPGFVGFADVAVFGAFVDPRVGPGRRAGSGKRVSVGWREEWRRRRHQLR